MWFHSFAPECDCSSCLFAAKEEEEKEEVGARGRAADMCVWVCVFRFFLAFFFILLPFGASEEDNAKLKPQRRCWFHCCSFCLFLSLCGLLKARLARGCRPERDRSCWGFNRNRKAWWEGGKRRRQGGQICLNWRFFWCIGERSAGAEQTEKLQSGIKRAFTARFLFPEEKIKAGNVFVNDWPDPCLPLQLSILGVLLQSFKANTLNAFMTNSVLFHICSDEVWLRGSDLLVLFVLT